MKKIWIVLLCALLFVSCSGEQETDRAYGDLQVRLLSTDVLSRALIPDQSALEFDYFAVTATGPQEKQVSIESGSAEVTLGNLLIGTWKIDATAYNGDDIPLVSGTVTTLLSSKTNTATLYLDTLVGSGSLAVTANWDPDQVASDVSLEVTLYDQNLDEVEQACTVTTASHQATITATDLPAGSYQLNLQLYSQGVLVSGAQEAVRIIDNTESSETIKMQIGDLSSTYTLAIINNTALPIAGTIAITPTTILPDSEVTMTYTAELPDDIEETDLEITWYCEGKEVKSGSNTYTSIPKPGIHRYDVLVNSPKLGSLGSTSLLFSMPLATEGD